ncbi:MAG: hypothetical protein COA45_11965 [Zetaproteobacteria bacterium]|nr:MAG: hypothetical protein COA45_11965 [Zetaproteobacteria bacterium]
MVDQVTDAFTSTQDDGNENVFLGTNKEKVLATYMRILSPKLDEIAVDSLDAVSLFRSDYMQGNERPAEYENLTDQDRKTYNEIVISYNKIVDAAERRVSLNKYSDSQNIPFTLENVFEMYQEAGISAAELEKDVFGLIRQNPTITAHPTGDLNEQRVVDLSTSEGVMGMVNRLLDQKNDVPAPLDDQSTAVDKTLRLVNAQDEEQAEHAIDSMMDMNMAPTRRLNTFEELVNAMSYAVRDRMATAELLENIHGASHDVYDVKKHSFPINVYDDNFSFASHISSWSDDTDGKPNAEHTALLSYDALNLLMGASFHLDNLKKIADLEPTIIVDDRFIDLKNSFSTIQERLAPILSETAQLYNLLQDPSLTAERRGGLYKENEEKFYALNEQVGKALDDIKFDGRSLNNHGVELFSRTERFFRGLTNELDGGEAQSLSRQSAALIHKNGMGFMKSESRTGRLVVNSVVNNLFENKDFIQFLNDKDVLTGDSQAALFKSGGQGISELDNKVLEKIFSEIHNEVKPETLLGFLKGSNPLVHNPDHGFPNQEYVFLKRLEVKAKFGLLHGPFITAEADHKSSMITRFLTNSLGGKLDKVPVMDLREDLHIMTDSTAGVELNRERMQRALQRRAEQDSNVRHQSLPEGQMWANSDSQKALGPLSSLMIAKQIQSDTNFVLDNWFNDRKMDGDVLPLLQKIGCGLDPQRGGGDPMVTARLVARTMQTFIADNDIDIDDFPDEFLRMALNVDYTVQGRATYRTVDEIHLDREQQVAEFLVIHAELKGIVEPGTAIPQTQPFSENMAAFLDEMVDDGMQAYNAARTAKLDADEQGSVLDSTINKTSPRSTVGKSNNAARMQSKGGSGATAHTQGRAIGTRNEIAAEGGHHDAFYSEGAFMQKMYTALHDDHTLKSGKTIQLTEDDINDFNNNGLWNYQLFTRTLMDAAQTDFTHAFEKLGMKDWDLDKLHRVSEGTNFVVHKGDDGIIKNVDFECPDDVAPEQALKSVYYTDFKKFTAGLNALSDGSFIKNKNLFSANPKGLTMTADFNKACIEKCPFIEPIRARSVEMEPALINLRKHDELDNTSEESDRAVASAWRTGYDKPKPELIGDGHKYAFGRRIEPVDLIQCLSEKYAPKADVSNDADLEHS